MVVLQLRHYPHLQVLSHFISLTYQGQTPLCPPIHQLLANSHCAHWIDAPREALTVVEIGLPRRLRPFMSYLTKVNMMCTMSPYGYCYDLKERGG